MLKNRVTYQALAKSNKNSFERILFVAPALIPTLQISFIRPLEPLFAQGRHTYDCILEQDFKFRRWSEMGFVSPVDFIEYKFKLLQPTLIVFCRYNGPNSKTILDIAEKNNITTIFHIDDNLFEVPIDLGQQKFDYYNDTTRLKNLHHLCNRVDLIYSSTTNLALELSALVKRKDILPGAIYCSGQVIKQATLRSTIKIGYMASADHVHNLTQVIGSLVRLLRKHPEVIFEFFGTISCPPELAEFGERIRHAPKIDNYDEFLDRFAEYQWDIGICPLNPIHFNMMKANTKWVEYTAIGAAVVASRGTVYDECCSQDCGLLAATEDEWFDALDLLVSDSDVRDKQIICAQKKLVNEYSIEKLREQVLNVFTRAHALHEPN